MNKVTIPREVAEAIEELRNAGMSNWAIIAIANDPSEYSYVIGEKCLGKYSTTLSRFKERDKLLGALVNGYEIEQTPEERLRDIFIDVANKRLSARSDGEYYVGMMDGIRTALNTLSIKIVGINAYDGDHDK
jgi:hypothetical protein